ncbi:uncharacterized protein [Apostichopus japonicus]|uniref:uncharacterized protein n=1 Tax=Stichopus japonicus TaxID=307972 RepID=UPI003AB3B594
MRVSVRRFYFACVVFIGSMEAINVLTFIRNQQPISKLKEVPKYLREIYDLKFRHDGDDTSDDWREWVNNRFKNDHLFKKHFQTIGSTKPFDDCRDKKPTLLLCVLSHPSRRSIRDAIRTTWANSTLVSTENVILWFIVGRNSINGIVDNETTTHESKEFGDVVIGNFEDNPKMESIKVLFSLYSVIRSCPSAVDVYIGNDDTYVNIPRLYRHLAYRNNGDKRIWSGFLRSGMKPVRDKQSPLYVSREEFKDDKYPDFCSLDNGFVLSASSVRDVLFFARNETLIKFPDVFLGILANKTHINTKLDLSFGSPVFSGNLPHCTVRLSMSTFRYQSNLLNHWQALVNITELKKCTIPDIDVVVPKRTNNERYFDQVLTYLHNNETLCSSVHDEYANVFVVSLISSHVRNYKQRNAIRETWGSQHLFFGRNVRYVFILGKKEGKNGAMIQELVAKEAQKYGDIVQGNFQESFKNLTLKVVLGLKWTTEFCSDAAYLYKGDEDMFVAWRNVIRFLLETSDKAGKEKMSRFFVGSKMRGSPRISNPKDRYYVNESYFAGDFYPLYCSGGSYVISNDIIPELFKKSLSTPLIPIDDAYQGMLTEQIGVHPVDHKGFRVLFKKGCFLQSPKTLTLHGFKSSQSLRNIWSKYQENEKCI